MKFNDALQWFGAVFIMIGHLLNTLGIKYHYDVLNIVAFAIGTIAFLIWTIRVSNKPQMTVNIMALIFMGFGLVKFFA
jgi:hypothetical protein